MQQKAYYYSACYPIFPTEASQIGILILENSKIIFNEISGQNYGELHVLPDINLNGINEIIISERINQQGYKYENLSIVEFRKNKLISLASMNSYFGRCSSGLPNTKDYALNLWVVKAVKPVFQYSVSEAACPTDDAPLKFSAPPVPQAFKIVKALNYESSRLGSIVLGR